jgi:hypothetical protein
MTRCGGWAAISTLLCALLLACGGGGGGATAGNSNEVPPVVVVPPPLNTATSNYFPLDSNTRRIYSTTAGTQPITTTAVGTQAVGTSTGTVLREVDPANASDDKTVYVVSATGVREYAPAGADALDKAFDGVETMRWPSNAGDSYVQVDKTIDSGRDFDGDGRADRVTVRAELTVVASETVITPAGTFEKCLHQRQVLTTTILPSSGAQSLAVTTSVDSWYATNVGLVKTVAVTRGAGANSSTTEILLAYRVGSRSSDTAPPVVQTVSPSTLPVRGAGTAVSAVFNKTLDPASFGPNSFTVVDGANSSIAGTVQVQGDTVRFVSAQTWASGTYTARISTAATDWIGNALTEPRTWTFTVDATAPGVVSSAPAANASNVALGSPVVLTFSEPPNPASVNSSNIILIQNNTVVPALLSVVGNQVNIMPTGGLLRGTTYDVRAFSVTDLLGNAMTQVYELQFTTTQGLFAFPTSLMPGHYIPATGVGDVNGDGLVDVVLSTQTNMIISEIALYVRYGRADGSLGPPVRVDMGPQMSCQPSAVLIGDVNGDGRPDVVLGSDFCGVQVLHQNASGSLVLGEHLAGRFATSRLRVADLNGDGRLDLVGVGGSATSGVDVWRQDGTGKLVFWRSVPMINFAGKDVEVGDVNGDGRPDLVVAVNGLVSLDVAVLLQQADGGFATLAFLSTGSPWGATGLALADLNGDGRTDIVATTGGNSPTYLAVYYQAAGGVLGPMTKLPTHDAPTAVRSADINGDGRADLVVSHSDFSSVGVYLQQANGVLLPEQRFRAPADGFGPQGMSLGDINRDGLIDIVLVGHWIQQLPGAGASVSTGNGVRLLSGAGRKQRLPHTAAFGP